VGDGAERGSPLQAVSSPAEKMRVAAVSSAALRNEVRRVMGGLRE
jgi:hypothetical protein